MGTNRMTLRGRALDLDVFFAEVNKRLFRGKMSDAQRKGILRILNAWDLFGNDLDTAACYPLATSYHETGQRMNPVIETFASTAEQAAARLQKAWKAGKLKWVKTPYWGGIKGHTWVGRGDVQLTHETNYKGPLRRAVLKQFDVDIATDPDLVLRGDISAFILIEGIMSAATLRGDFTGRALEEFVNETKTDYHNARRTVNPGEKDSYAKVAGYASVFEVAMVKARAAAGEAFTGAESDVYQGRFDAKVETVQRKLKELGYHEVGSPDGRWGSRTAAAVLAFRNDHDLPLEAKIDAPLLTALAEAEPRSIAPARAMATVEDLREKGSTEVASNDAMSRVGKITAAVSGAAVVADESGILDKVSENSDQIGVALSLVERVKDVIADNALLLLVGLGVGLAYWAWSNNRRRLERHRSGEYLSR
jgi:peptidoglycan hydrolase-like protein with peptidoglycan-binding domain